MILFTAHATHRTPVEATYPDGTVKRFESLTACSQEVGTSLANLRQLIKHKREFNGITFRKV